MAKVRKSSFGKQEDLIKHREHLGAWLMYCANNALALPAKSPVKINHLRRNEK